MMEKKKPITLSAAVKEGKVQATRKLLAAGADPRRVAPGFERYTPLHWASRRGHTTVARLLIEHGADVNAQDRNSDAPLHLACTHDRPDIVWLLLEKGADVDARNVWGTTPLHLVARRINWKLVRLLLDAGADVNARNRGNCTPLHKACSGVQGPRRARRTETIRLLLSHGAEGGARDKDEMTPVGFVLEMKPDHPAREEIIDLFREYAPEAVMEAYCTAQERR